MMPIRQRTPNRWVLLPAAALLGLSALTVTPATAQATAPAVTQATGGGAAGQAFPARIALPDGFQPEGVAGGGGTTLFAGSLVDGAIWRGDARTGTGSVFVAGVAGRVAVGLEYERSAHRLWVAGGPTGAVTVYDARTGTELARYAVPGSGFLNDLVVTPTAAYVTDSVVQRLVVIPLGGNGSLPGPGGVHTLPLTGDISYVTGFNANGIESTDGGRILLLVQSATSTLFRVVAATGETRALTLTGGALTDGDGLVLRGRTLYVVRGTPNAVVTVRLGRHLVEGRIMRTITSPGLDVPSTATFAAGRLYAVNARFGTPPGPGVEYSITRLSGR